MSIASFVHVNVGGLMYSISVSDIEKFPNSFFHCMIKKEWTNNSIDPIRIQRDGALFKYVYAYIVTGNLPRDKDGLIDLDGAALDGLKSEADFYGLESLLNECNIRRRKGAGLDLNSYLTIRKYIARYPRERGRFQIESSSHLVRTLQCVWSPFCVSGKFHAHSSSFGRAFYGGSSLLSVNLPELIAAATQSPFGRGTETVVDTSVRNSFEIDASKLDSAVLDAISVKTDCAQLAPHLDLSLRPYKLVIYKEGGHFDQHRDTVRGEGHIGTLVVILNSQYTGGELEVTHGGRTEVVTGPYSWVAMYGDCLHKINPVTSGTRVSLIYDIYGTTPVVASAPVFTDLTSSNFEEEEEEDYEDNDEEMEVDSDNEPFWEHQPNGRYCNYSTAASLPDKRRLPNGTEIASVLEALDGELKYYDSIIICLQHLYPECQTNPAFLKGGDRVLYDILTGSDSIYDVQVVAATIYRCHDYGYEEFMENRTSGALFSPAIVKHAMGVKTDSDGEEETEAAHGAPVEPALEKQKADPAADMGRTKLVLPKNLDRDNLLDYTPYDEHAGNEPQAEETVYIVAGLQVRRRV